MNYEKLQSILFKSTIKLMAIGIPMLLFGIYIIAFPFLDESFQGSTMALVIIGGLITLGGIVVLIKSIPIAIGAKTGNHPFLKAIKNGQRDYIYWVYGQQINTTLGNGGETIGKSNNINYFSKDCKGKGIPIVLSKKDSPDEFIEFLQNHFDIPYIGYADETREAVNKYFGTSGLKKL